jgi:hypothetical protein
VPTSRSTLWVADEFDRRAATYDDNRQHIWQAELAAQCSMRSPGNNSSGR